MLLKTKPPPVSGGGLSTDCSLAATSIHDADSNLAANNLQEFAAMAAKAYEAAGLGSRGRRGLLHSGLALSADDDPECRNVPLSRPALCEAPGAAAGRTD